MVVNFGVFFAALGISLLEFPEFGAVMALVKDCMARIILILWAMEALGINYLPVGV
jgi:uncharacterized membrane protein